MLISVMSITDFGKNLKPSTKVSVFLETATVSGEHCRINLIKPRISKKSDTHFHKKHKLVSCDGKFVWRAQKINLMVKKSAQLLFPAAAAQFWMLKIENL